MEKGNILILDDEEFVLKALARELASDAYEIFEARDVRSALKILSEEPVDVVISDLHLPGVLGGSFLRIVKDHYPHIVRIILTGYPDTDSAVRAINEEDVFRYFSKPWRREELVNALGQAMKIRNSESERQKVINGIIENVERLKSLQTGLNK